MIRVLCVEDNPHDRALIRDALERESEKFAMIEAGDRPAFEKALAERGFDAVISDFNILGFEGLEVIRKVKDRFPDMPVIVVTGTGSEEVAVAALKQGADDYVIKTPSHIAQLPHTILRAIESQQNRRSLKQAEVNLLAVLENISDAILVVDTGGTILYANPAGHQMLGNPPEGLVGKSFGYPIAEGVAVDIDLPLRPGGPGIAEVRVTKGIWYNKDCRIVVLRDITGRKAAEEALRESERKLRIYNEISNVFLKASPEDMYGQILSVIRRVTKSRLGLFGYIDENGNFVCPSLTKDVWSQCQIPDKDIVFPKEKWAGLWGRAMLEKKTLWSNEPLMTPEGHLPLNCAMAVPVLYEKRLIANIVLANKEAPYHEGDAALVETIANYIAPILSSMLQKDRDRREKKQLQEQLNQAQKMESIGRLAGGVAHDFNNMLGVILGYGENLLHQLHQGDPLREDVKEIVAAGKRSAALTRQLLAFSRKLPLQPEVLDLNALLRELARMLQRLIGEDVELKLALAGELDRVMADPGQIEQVILNLAVNARDAMPRGGKLTIETANVKLDETYVQGHVDVTPGEYVMLAVSDTGCGMDGEILSRIFDPFFTTKQKGEGTGLGLATVYGIVKQSGGHIWPYSEPGRGTTFKVYLPRTETMQQPKPAAGEKAATAAGEHILVVEDEETLRKMIKAMLSRLGYRVSLAANGGEALLLMEEKGLKPDLLITDVVMPKISGKELADRLQRSRPELKVLYMSGYTDNSIIHHGILDPGTHFIQKPFTLDDIAQKVHEVLRATA